MLRLLKALLQACFGQLDNHWQGALSTMIRLPRRMLSSMWSVLSRILRSGHPPQPPIPLFDQLAGHDGRIVIDSDGLCWRLSNCETTARGKR